MADFSSRDNQNPDDPLNPANSLRKQEDEAAQTSTSNDDSSSVQDKESENSINYTGSGQGNQKQSFDIRAYAKRKGPLAAIIALIGGGGLGFTFLSMPALVAFHFTETLSEDLNDQLAAADIRTDHILRTKLKQMAAIGYCSETVNIRCKFGTMSRYQISNFEKAGFKLDCNGSPCDRLVANRLTSITLPNGDVVNDPNQLMGRAATNQVVRTDLRRAFNPVYRMMSDNVANKAFTKWGGKTNRFVGTKKDDLHKKLLTSTETRAVEIGKLQKIDNQWVDSDGSVPTENGQPLTFTDPEAQAHNDTAARIERTGGVGKVAGSLLKGASVIGAADLACTAYNSYRTISSGAKVLRSEALGRLAASHHSAVQAAKAGDETVTPEQMSFMGDMLTETDTRKEIADPTKEGQLMDNPNYGRSAMDSAFYKTSAYGDVPNLQPESLQYMVGGGAVGTFQELAGILKNKPSGCKVIQHPITRGVVGVGSLLLGIGTGGATLAASASLSIAASFAVQYLEGMVTDMLAGKTVDESTRATQYGDAMFTGTAVIMGGISKNRGLRPLTNDNISAYMNTSSEVAATNASIERTMAQSTPFDIYNQYSFIGSFARSTLPATQSIKSLSSSSITGIASLIPQSISTFIPKSSALDNSKGRFSQCDDEDYKALNIAADIACNVRYGLTDKELALDPEVVLDYMEGTHIDESGAPKSDEYKKYLELCVTPTEGIFSPLGEESEGNIDDWKICTEDGPGDIYNYFRVYTLDKTIIDAMDEEPTSQAAPSEESTLNGELVDGTPAELVGMILNNGNVTLQANPAIQLALTASGSDVGVSKEILQVLATLGQTEKFQISSLKRGGGGTSRHNIGKAVDLSLRHGGINGATQQDYGTYNETITTFVKKAAALLPANCEIGLPNQRYVDAIKPVAKPGCYVFIDKGSAPHIHLAVAR